MLGLWSCVDVICIGDMVVLFVCCTVRSYTLFSSCTYITVDVGVCGACGVDDVGDGDGENDGVDVSGDVVGVVDVCVDVDDDVCGCDVHL